MNPVVGIVVKDVKTFFREKGTVFWTIAFPVIVLLLFSAIFGREIPFNANIGIINEDGQTPITDSVISGLKEMKIFTLKNFTDKNKALEELNATNVRAVLIIPKNFTQNLLMGKANVSLIIDETNLDVARLIKDGIKTFFTEYYKNLNPHYTEPIIVDEEPIKGRVIGYKEYILPGVLCYPLLFSSMVASTGAIVYEREKGTLKRIRASPIGPLKMLVGKTFAALFQTAISILIIAVLAAVLLNPKVDWNIPLMFPIMFLGSLNGIALGLLISCIGRSPQEASGAATTIGIVLQWFTGMYFPLEYLPTYLQQVSNFIPMTYAAQAVRAIMIQNATLSSVLPSLITLVFTAVALYIVGIFLYKRWVEKE